MYSHSVNEFTYSHVHTVYSHIHTVFRHIVVDIELRPEELLERTTASAGATASARATGAIKFPWAAGSAGGSSGSNAATGPKRGQGSGKGSGGKDSPGSAEAGFWFQRPVADLPHVRTVDLSKSPWQKGQSDEGNSAAPLEGNGVGRNPPARWNVGMPSWQWFESEVSERREPALLTGMDLGPAVDKWTPAYLAGLPSSQRTTVSVHVTSDPQGRLDFVDKNFQVSRLGKHYW